MCVRRTHTTIQTPPTRMTRVQSSLPATLPMRIQVRLPNGVEVDLGETRLDELTGVMQILSALPCSS